MENQPKIEQIEKAYKEEEYGKRIAPAERVWKELSRKKRFKSWWYFLVSLLTLICLLSPFSCLNFNELKLVGNSPLDLKRDSLNSTETTSTKYAQKAHRETKDASSKTLTQSWVVDYIEFGSSEEQLNNPYQGYNEKIEQFERTTDAASVLEKNIEHQARQKTPASEFHLTDKSAITPSDLNPMMQLCASIDRTLKPILKITDLSIEPIAYKKKWAASSGFLFDIRKYALSNPISIEGMDNLRFREKGLYLNVNAPCSKSVSLNGGVEFLKSSVIKGNEYIEDIQLIMEYDSIGTLIDPISGDTITILDSSIVAVDKSRFADYEISVETINIPISFGYKINKGRFSIIPSLGICYQMSQFHIKGNNRADLPDPFQENSHIEYKALFISGQLRIVYSLSEHLLLEAAGSCRGLIFEKSDYFTSTPSPGYGIFHAGICYVF